MRGAIGNRQFLKNVRMLIEYGEDLDQDTASNLLELATEYYNKRKKEHNHNKTLRIQIKLLCKTLEELSSRSSSRKTAEQWLDISTKAAKKFRTSSDKYYSLD